VILQMCMRCIIDNTNPDLDLDDKGVCAACREAEIKIGSFSFSKVDESENLQEIAARIKSQKRGQYDSILGLSGGVDSSYVAYLAMEMGLSPLCVHFDNGWNSDIAVKNIRRIVDVTGFDLKTYVIDWPEFRDLQRAFFKAGVIDIELLTDHAIFASLFRIRREFKIKTVLSGTNYSTEHGMPPSWLWNKMDLRNIRAIQKRFGDMRIKTFPTMNTISWLLMRKFGIGGVFEEPLNFVNYRKSEAMEQIKSRFGWEYYGGKHYESKFTKFYQAYVLPEKFGIDKRRVHLSALIRNGEMSREEALEELKIPLYDPKEFLEDKRFVLKKLGFSEVDFDALMAKEPVPHDFYPSDSVYIKPMVRIAKKFMTKIS
jgi:N-acetyl sugar amidotransferase